MVILDEDLVGMTSIEAECNSILVIETTSNGPAATHRGKPGETASRRAGVARANPQPS
jgi:hypothetical protein